MDPINDIQIPNSGIPFIQVNGTGIRLIQVQGQGVGRIGTGYIADSRIWVQNSPQAIPISVPVTTVIGVPIVNMPGCVKIHKENNKRDPSKNKMLVDDDPKGNTVLCDAGAPYYEPPNYDYRDLTWQTITQEQPEPEGVDTGDPPAPDLDTPEPPPTPPTGAEDVECPPLNARRIGDLNTKGDERVKEYKLTPDGKICETIWEPVPTIEQFLPSIPTVTTTASIAAVATTSALLAKPLADLLLKVVKPVVKKVIAKVNALRGKQEKRLSVQERVLAQRDRNRAVMELRKALKK